MAAGGAKRRLVAFVVEPDPDDPADVIGDEPVWHDGKVVGWITSGGYGHHVSDRSPWATCRPSSRRPTARAAVVSRSRSSVVGCPARLQPEPLFDPSGGRMRA